MSSRPLYKSHHDFGWSYVPLRYDGEIVEHHIVPESDLHQHEMGPNCWCAPAKRNGNIIHNSADQRELYETGELVPN